MNNLKLLIVPILFAIGGCAQTHKSAVQSDEQTNNLTAGKVQREIRTGMPSSEVIGILGSPNIVTRDKNKLEVWVYDKISTNYSFSNSSGKIAISIFDYNAGFTSIPNPAVLGFLDGRQDASLINHSAGYNRSAGAVNSNQKTLTIIIKISADGLVEDFTYHASSF